jgi:hypothetical protein
MSIVISASVVTDNPEHATRAAEVLARAATGLVLEGIYVNVSMGIAEEETEEVTGDVE